MNPNSNAILKRYASNAGQLFIWPFYKVISFYFDLFIFNTLHFLRFSELKNKRNKDLRYLRKMYYTFKSTHIAYNDKINDKSLLKYKLIFTRWFHCDLHFVNIIAISRSKSHNVTLWKCRVVELDTEIDKSRGQKLSF